MINNGDARVKKVSPLTKTGILGKKLVLAIGDAETKPNSAVQAATRFIRQDKAMMIAGSVSSSVAIALQNTCERAKTLYRSEEHTSELQSLMRISYAVFCLKKKKITKLPQHSPPPTK